MMSSHSVNTFESSYVHVLTHHRETLSPPSPRFVRPGGCGISFPPFLSPTRAVGDLEMVSVRTLTSAQHLHKCIPFQGVIFRFLSFE